MYYLMNKDTPMLGYDFDDQYIVVIDNDMLPYNLKDNIKTTEYISKEPAKKAGADINTLCYFLTDRVLEERFPEDFHKMVFADYILANTDRHTENWWFRVEPALNAIIGFGPLMDHNLSLIADRFRTDIDDIIYDSTDVTFGETIEKYAPFISKIDDRT